MSKYEYNFRPSTYFLRCTGNGESFIKVISSTKKLEHELKRINTSYEIKLIDSAPVYWLGDMILDMFNNKSYKPKHKIIGSTKCLNVDDDKLMQMVYYILYRPCTISIDELDYLSIAQEY